MNGSGKDKDISAKSVPQYELVSNAGDIFGPFNTAGEAAAWAKRRWPDQAGQDQDREGWGWDIQVVGADS